MNINSDVGIYGLALVVLVGFIALVLIARWALKECLFFSEQGNALPFLVNLAFLLVVAFLFFCGGMGIFSLIVGEDDQYVQNEKPVAMVCINQQDYQKVKGLLMQQQ